jgi:CBS-domain-containing membrane protein
VLSESTYQEIAMNVADVMSRDVRVCRAQDSLNEAARMMWEGDCGCVPVVDEQKRVIGVVTDRDVCMCAYIQGGSLASLSVGAAMSHGVHVCRPTDSLAGAASTMQDHQIRRLPVVDDENRIIGVLSVADVARETERQKGNGRRRDLSPESFTQVLATICEPRGNHVAALEHATGNA